MTEKQNKSPKLCIIVPCYNEEEVLHEADKALSKKLDEMISHGKISHDSFICYVNDGSKDSTWKIITELAESRSSVRGICLSRNRGHQNALLCGLTECIGTADCYISIDADLQDDISAMDEMVDKYTEGCGVVYGVRRERPNDTFFKRNTALMFYRIMRMLDKETVYNHADYRLLSNEALRALAEFKEAKVYIRGLIPKLGFKSDAVYYDRKERFAGESKYTLTKMLSLAGEGILSSSMKPIRAVTALGALFAAFGALYAVLCAVKAMFGSSVPDWAPLTASLWFVGGMIMLSLGIVGEYIGGIYTEVKHRPRYIVEKKVNF